MVSGKERLQRIWHQYDSRRDHKPSSMRQAAAWAVTDGLLRCQRLIQSTFWQTRQTRWPKQFGKSTEPTRKDGATV
ncbi:MAG: hypothetical protein DMG39_08905 [Acidobacteria bacterium]|nr:MAG: hypothetical protein DMG39_08905 [Acidobacteriota bacterium]